MNAVRVSSALLLVLASVGVNATETALRVPSFKLAEVLVASELREGRARYPAFPALLPLTGGRVLLTYKNGHGHTHDPGAEVATLEVNLAQGTWNDGVQIAPPDPLLYQCAEPVRFADGRVGLLLDTQFIGPEPRHYRAPMRWTTSADEGRTFTAPVVFPVVEGTGYGYPQEGLTLDGTTYLMVMSFGYLAGSHWSMDILRTEDSGSSWFHVRDLALELKVPGFNEGAMMAHGDGFLIASRSYDGIARLHEVDAAFRLRRQVTLTGASPWIHGYIGRPRWLRHGGNIYLLGRNWTQPAAMPARRSGDNPLGFQPAQQLCLFRIDPATLQPVTGWILDNAENASVTDGYYAVAASSGTAPEEKLHVFTYKALAGGPPNLVRFEFKWSEFLE